MISKDLDKEILQDLYITKNKTAYEIAEILQVNRSTVVRYLKKYQIAINPKQRKFELIKKVPFTKEQKELIIGTLLGDGCISPHGRKNKSYRLLVGHCEQQKDLLLYKKAMLGNFVNSIRVHHDKRKNSIMHSFNTVVHNEFKFFYDLFYENGKKVIRDSLVMYLTPRALAFWIMDDGSSGSKNQNTTSLRLHTECFTEEENIKLQGFLKICFDIRSKVCKFNRNEKEYCYLSINKENTLKTSKIVENYFVDCMKYKIYIDPQRLERQSSQKCEGDTV
jgi:recombination protein RecA